MRAITSGSSDPGAVAVAAGLDGRETNTFLKRRDDRSEPGHAAMRRRGEKVFGPGDAVTRLPGTIHNMRNETEAVTVSPYVYRYKVNLTNRSDSGQTRKRPVVLNLVHER